MRHADLVKRPAAKEREVAPQRRPLARLRLCRFRLRAQVWKSGPHPYTTKISKIRSSTTSRTFMRVCLL